MLLKKEEIIVLNQLLDGNKIKGFAEEEEKDERNTEQLEKIAEQLMQKGKDKMDMALKTLNCYKHATEYLIINGTWTALLSDCDVTLACVNGKYEMVVWDKGEYVKKVYESTELFNRIGNENDAKPVSVNVVEQVKEIESKAGCFAIIMNYSEERMRKFNVIYEMNEDRYCLNVFTMQNSKVNNREIYKIIKECGGIQDNE